MLFYVIEFFPASVAKQLYEKNIRYAFCAYEPL